MDKFIPYGRQDITDNDIKSVVDVLKSDFLTQGPKVSEFEELLASMLNAKYAVCFNSGTSALHAAYYVLDIKEGDEVITTPNTFAATSNAALYLGAKPVFVDVENDTGNIDASKIEQKITSRTKLISAVHFGGHPVDLEEIKAIADKYKLHFVEDACHAIGALYKGEKIGNCKLSDMSIFSFHPVKHIAIGEGGAITTNNPKLYKRLLKFRTHGITKVDLKYENQGEWYYEMQELGFNYRMMDYQAALGISQLYRLKENVVRRREIAEYYNKSFKENPWFDLPPERDFIESSYHLYHIRLKPKYALQKKEIFDELRKAKLGVQTHYIPVYMHPYYRENGYADINLPIVEDFYNSEISIPMFHSLTKDDQALVIDRITKVFSEFSYL